MEKKASEIQKERISEIEGKAEELLNSCEVVTLTSVNEKGYPRTCLMSKAKNDGFTDIYFVTSKRSKLNGKATHFENNKKASVCYFKGSDSVTLIGEVEFIEDREFQKKYLRSRKENFSAKELMILNFDF